MLTFFPSIDSQRAADNYSVAWNGKRRGLRNGLSFGDEFYTPCKYRFVGLNFLNLNLTLSGLF